MNLSPHFTLAELTASQTAARKGLDNTPSPEVLANLKRTALGLEAIRMVLGAPISISSGYRSPAVNKAVGGVTNSQHLTGQAVDFICPGFGKPERVVRAILASGIVFDQVIHEFDSWVHISFADKPRMQALTIDRKGKRSFE